MALNSTIKPTRNRYVPRKIQPTRCARGFPGTGFPGTVYFISFSCPSASRPSWAATSYPLIVLASLQSQQSPKAFRCVNAIHNWYYRADHPPSDTPAGHSPTLRDSALGQANHRCPALNDTAHSTTPNLLVSVPTPREPDSSPHTERRQLNAVRPSGKNGNAPATDDLANLHGNLPYACICDEPRQTWLKATCSGAAPPQTGRGYSSDTKQKNPTSASTPTGTIGRGILVGRERRRKHPSCARPAARRDAGNLERPLGRSLAWRHILHLSHATCQLLYTVPGIHRNSKRPS